eukprot:4829259-Pyramimonas_sp.AAC.1
MTSERVGGLVTQARAEGERQLAQAVQEAEKANRRAGERQLAERVRQAEQAARVEAYRQLARR